MHIRERKDILEVFLNLIKLPLDRYLYPNAHLKTILVITIGNQELYFRYSETSKNRTSVFRNTC